MTIKLEPNWIRINACVNYFLVSSVVILLVGSYIYLIIQKVQYLASLSVPCIVDGCPEAVAYGTFVLLNGVFSVTMFYVENLANFEYPSMQQSTYFLKIRRMLVSDWRFRLWDCCVMLFLPFLLWEVVVKATLYQKTAWHIYAYIFAVVAHSVKYLVAFLFNVSRQTV